MFYGQIDSGNVALWRFTVDILKTQRSSSQESVELYPTQPLPSHLSPVLCQFGECWFRNPKSPLHVGVGPPLFSVTYWELFSCQCKGLDPLMLHTVGVQYKNYVACLTDAPTLSWSVTKRHTFAKQLAGFLGELGSTGELTGFPWEANHQ